MACNAQYRKLVLDFNYCPKFIYPVEEGDKVLLKFEHKFGGSSKTSYRLVDFKKVQETVFKEQAESISFVERDGNSYELYDKNGQSSDNSSFIRARKLDGTDITINYRTFMHFIFKKEFHLDSVKKSLQARLTKTGKDEFSFLESHLTNVYQVLNKKKFFYANFISLIQSSGSGKSKLCLELLLHHPGLFFVFRKPNDNGIPEMMNWMKNFKEFILIASSDELPQIDVELLFDDALNYSPTRFLIALKYILDLYLKLYDETLKDLEKKAEDKQETSETKKNIYSKALKIVGEKIFDAMPASSSEYSKIFKCNGSNYKSIKEVITGIEESVDKILKLTKALSAVSSAKNPSSTGNAQDSENFSPFLLFLDELDVFDYLKPDTRLSGNDHLFWYTKI
jgi:hypothetical protein